MLNQDNTRNEVIKALIHLWGPISEGQQKAFLNNVQIKRIIKGQYIYRDIDNPNCMKLLIHGKVKVSKMGIGGRNQIIRIVKPMEFFGFRAYFADESYTTEAMALEDSTIAYIDMYIIIQMMKENFNINLFFLKNLSKELGHFANRIVNLTQKHIRARLAEALLLLKDNYGLEDDGYTLSIYLSREDLANLSNMTTSNAIRTLSAFANEKLIAIDGRKIKFLNSEELKKINKMG